ncbi:MAG TPA: hypothetical protein PKY59_13250 [Pyrinomonadaceae bacterium]|nr:hypothetical protein [Pyrinomonadaceae bacterium]
MKMKLLILTIVFLAVSNIFAQTEIKMRVDPNFDSPDILSILRFESIGFEKAVFSGSELKNKHYIITIKEFTDGKLARTETAFDSNELGDFAKIKGETFGFRVLTKITPEKTAKFQFQFDRFSVVKEYKVGENFKDFALKNFLGTSIETVIPSNKNTYIFTYMMPYEKKDGSKAYCEVAQSGANPEDFGKKFSIPTYFLIDIKFQ